MRDTGLNLHHQTATGGLPLKVTEKLAQSTENLPPPKGRLVSGARSDFPVGSALLFREEALQAQGFAGQRWVVAAWLAMTVVGCASPPQRRNAIASPAVSAAQPDIGQAEWAAFLAPRISVGTAGAVASDSPALTFYHAIDDDAVGCSDQQHALDWPEKGQQLNAEMGLHFLQDGKCFPTTSDVEWTLVRRGAMRGIVLMKTGNANEGVSLYFPSRVMVDSNGAHPPGE